MNRKLPAEARRRVKEKSIGLTPRQVFWLEHDWQLICDAVDIGPNYTKVRDQFRKLERHAAAIRHWCTEGSRPSDTRSSANIAFGHLGLVAREVLADTANKPDSDKDALPDRIDWIVLAELLEAAAHRAQSHFRTGLQKPRASRVKAVELVVHALKRAEDVSEQQAKRLKASRAPGAPFVSLLEVVFEHASAGKTAGGKGVDTAIREFLKRQK
jgi:hypothetical protein